METMFYVLISRGAAGACFLLYSSTILCSVLYRSLLFCHLLALPSMLHLEGCITSVRSSFYDLLHSASASQRCEYCPEGLFSRQFYLFPCSHGMHTDCLLRRTYSHHHLDGARLSAVKGLEEQLRSIKTRAKDDKRALAQQELWQNELDGYIAGDCPLCGYIMIQSLEQPLITQNDVDEARSWDL